MRPWSPIPIHDCGEPLLPLPPELWRLEPHPYACVGAPYGEGASPFRLRAGVIERLLQAQSRLQHTSPTWRLAIFDAWRPIAVQRFMVAFATAEECAARGVDPSRPSPERQAVEENTGEKFTFTERLHAHADFVGDLHPADCDARTRGLAHVCLVLLNTNEFAHVD